MKGYVIGLWDGYDNHYRTYETDDITIDGIPLEEHDTKVRVDVINEFLDLIADEIGKVYRYSRMTRSGALTVDEISGCVKSAKEKLEEVKI